MDFVMQWLWCVLAFLGGSATGWALVTVLIKRTSADDVDSMAAGPR